RLHRVAVGSYLAVTCFNVAFVIMFVGYGFAQEPIHVRIDKSVAELYPGSETPLCTDAEFVRRVYLDLIGTIPTVEQTKQFITDANAAKRQLLIDSLIQSGAHKRHLVHIFDIMFMERRADKHVKAEQWHSYLLTSFQANKPYNEMAREILAADGVEAAKRGPAKFYLEREVEPNLIAREVGRMFFGMDIQCAQCHDHPTIDDYLQSDYYGIYAFVSRTYLFQPDKKQPAVLAEKADGDAKFKSVFTAEEGSTRPRLPGSPQIDEPSFGKDQGYQVKPEKNVRPVPTFSRRGQLARLATDGSNQAFNRNIVNRLWAHMMGRGIVHPVDFHHSDNPPIHPKLLSQLANDFVGQKFATSSFLRELALSRTYQRSIDLPQDIATQSAAAVQKLAEIGTQITTLEAAAQIKRDEVVAFEKQQNSQAAAVAALQAKHTETAALEAKSKIVLDAATKLLQPLSVDLAAKQATLNALATAEANANLAAAKLPDDAEFSAAVATITSRKTAYSTLAAEASKKASEQQSAVDVANQMLQVAVTELQKITQQQSALASTLKKLDLDAVQVHKTAIELQTQSAFHHQHKKRLETLVVLGEASRQLDANRQAHTQSTQLLVELRTAAAEGKAKLSAVNTKQQTITQQLATHQAELTAATKNLAAKSEAAQLVKTAHQSADSAAQKDGDAKLAEAVATLKRRADQLAAEATQLTAETQRLTPLVDQEKSMLTLLASEMAAIAKAVSNAEAGIAANQKIIADGQQSLPQLQQTYEIAYVGAVDALSTQFSVAVIRPLGPEQLTNSMLTATGYIETLQQSAKAEIDKKTPLKEEDKQDALKVTTYEQAVENQLLLKTKPVIAKFTKLFAAAAGQPQSQFFATVDQSLFFANGGDLQSWLTPRDNNLMARLQKLEDPAAAGDELYLSVLCRKPTPQEANDVTQFLANRTDDRGAALRDIAWALLTSTEFRFQH
ncbi:MAG: hypothetical protein ACI9HK_004099, partial [Pirellulaceae bacterium]